MRVIAAPNAFKGCLSAGQAAEAIRRGVLKACPQSDVLCVPVADGGDGLLEVAVEALHGEICEVVVKGPRMVDHPSSFGWIATTRVAVIEMANASGLTLVQEGERDPAETSTLGTGQLIRAALDKGAEKIIVGLGGSATCDGGIGMAAALGYRFLDRNGAEIHPIGKSLQSIAAIDTTRVDSRLSRVVFQGVCDVTNPLTGKDGASYVYSPQKGATVEQVEQLDAGLANLAEVILRDMDMEVRHLQGGGAAGGLGAGLYCFVGALLEKGIDVVIDLVDLKTKIQGANLIITGEGQIDHQTRFDKAPAGVAKVAQHNKIPCIAVCGSVGDGIEELYDIGICSVFSICPGPISLAEAMADGFTLLEDRVEQVMRTYGAAHLYSES